MILATYIFATLSTNSDLMEALGGDSSKIFPVFSQDPVTAPYVSFIKVGGGSVTDTHDGSSGGSLDVVSVQFSCFGKTYNEAENLRRLVRKAIENGDKSQVQTNPGQERDLYETATKIFNHQIDFDFHYDPS